MDLLEREADLELPDEAEDGWRLVPVSPDRVTQQGSYFASPSCRDENTRRADHTVCPATLRGRTTSLSLSMLKASVHTVSRALATIVLALPFVGILFVRTM